MAAVNYGSIKGDKFEKYQGPEPWTLGPKDYILLILLQELSERRDPHWEKLSIGSSCEAFTSHWWGLTQSIVGGAIPELDEKGRKQYPTITFCISSCLQVFVQIQFLSSWLLKMNYYVEPCVS